MTDIVIRVFGFI